MRQSDNRGTSGGDDGRRRLAPLVGVLAVAALAAGCGTGGSTTSPTSATPVAQATSAGGTALVEMLTNAIQDEYRAQAVYQRVLMDHGTVLPFSNIVQAEGRHADAIATLFRTRGLPVPSSRWTIDDVPGFATVREACAAGVTAEVDNIALYDRYLAEDLDRDVRNVFTNNRAASQLNHLPAFERCR